VNENPTPPPAAAPEIRNAQRWNIVWVVPLVALLLGGWMLFRQFTTAGPVARVRFETAEEIFANKTEVRCRSVTVGIVRNVELAADLQSVTVHIEMDSSAEHLLREGARFWVVKPRVSGSGISGLGTLIQGAYIELDPGASGAPAASGFMGLETPPATNLTVPGRRVVLTADEAGLLTAGSALYYRGFEVGRIEARTLSPDGARVSYNAFIQQEYSGLVTENTRFWNTSGIDISAGAEGFKVRTPSLQAMVSGGVSFGLPDGGELGKPVADGASFILHRDEDAARNATFTPTMKVLLLFDQTVRGLSNRATVEFRGITIGRVADISFDLVPANGDPRIPVLIEIDCRLMRRDVHEDAEKNKDAEFLTELVDRGLRASLKTGSLITGALFVDLDYYSDVAPAKIGKAGEYVTIPTVSTGFAQLEAKLTAILDKVNELPIEKTMNDIAAAANEAKITITESRMLLAELEKTAAAARATLEDPAFRELPGQLRKSIAALEKSIASLGPEGAVQGDMLRSLDELRAALRAMKSLSNTIEEKPNSLIFDKKSTGNPSPKAPRGGR
jgi:paraquat-inducible protein B